MARVTTEYGVLEGLEADGIHHFRNVPFAAPPFGALRFRAPQHPEPWDGVRDATKAGPSVPQPLEGGPMAAAYEPTAIGEDCLTLEVWTPDPGAAGLPVIVHTHGGGYAFGGGALPGYSGRTFARDGVVFVGVNYRLGIDGFTHIPDAADNRGLRDQAFALEWVQRNIAAFGGDPAKVTIMGQSGGAVSVMNNLSMPSSIGRFRGAISMSGCSMPSVDADEAMTWTRKIAKILKVKPTLAGFADVPIERTTKATRKALEQFLLGLAFGRSESLLISPFRAVHGTETLPLSPLETARAGRSAAVPLLAGTARNETGGFVSAISELGPLGPIASRGLFGALKKVNAPLGAYADGPRRLTKRAEVAEAAWSDWGFRIPTILLLEAWQQPKWLYEFRWQSELLPPGQGALHALDNPFAWDNVDDVLALTGQGGRDLLGAHPSQAVATAMHGAFVQFAKTGEAPWPQYDTDDRATRIFETGDEVVSDAAGSERAAWVGRR